VFNVADAEPYEVRRIIRTICQALGRGEPSVHIPVVTARAAAAILEVASALTGAKTPLTRAVLAKYLEESAVDTSRIRRVLGWGPRVSLEEGWTRAIRDLRKTGELPPA